MNPIIEIITNNIMTNNKYDKNTKDEYVNMMNRIEKTKIIMEQQFRSMNFALFNNTKFEEINYILKQKKYFIINFDENTREILNDYLDSISNFYNTKFI